MACALYIACRQSAVPTTDKSTTVEGNCVSLTSLLKKTNLRYVILNLILVRMYLYLQLSAKVIENVRS